MTSEQLIPPGRAVYINGIDVTSYLTSFEVLQASTGISTAGIVVSKDVTTLITPSNGNIIEVYYGRNDGTLVRKFYGIAISIDYDASGYNLSASDELWKSTGTPIVKLYDINSPTDMFGGDIRLIFMDLCTQCGLTANNTTIDPTSVIVPQVVCDNVKAQQKLQEMADVLFWDFYQDPVTRLINLKNPSSYPTYPTQFEVGVNVVNNPEYNENIVEMINCVELQGVTSYPTDVMSFTSDGITTRYNTNKRPISTYIKVTDNGSIVDIAVEGSSNDSLATCVVNKNEGYIKFNTVPTAGHAIVIDYTYEEITTVVVQDDESVSQYGLRKLVQVLNDTASVDDATQRAREIVAQYKQPFPTLNILTYNVYDITTRYKVDYADEIKGIYLLGMRIETIKWSWPNPGIEIKISRSRYDVQNLLYTVEERVKKLERSRRENVLLTVHQFYDNRFYFVYDDLEIIKELISSGLQTTITKRKFKWNSFDEFNLGTYDDNIDIYSGDIRLI